MYVSTAENCCADFKEAIKLAFFRLVEKLKISYNAVHYSLHRTAQTGSNQNRKSGSPRCTTEQKDKYISV